MDLRVGCNNANIYIQIVFLNVYRLRYVHDTRLSSGN